MSDHIKVPCIGSMVKADHPVTCLNPTEWFAVYEIKYEPVHNKFWVRGENTMWFNLNMITLRENSHSNLSKKIRGHANYLRGHVGLTGSDAIWATFAANEIALAADFLEPKEGVDNIENWRWYEGTWGNSNIVRYDTLGDVVGIARIEDTSTRLNVIAKHNVTLDKVSIKDNNCICHGNWRNIVKNVDQLIGKHFLDHKGEEFKFFGIVHGDDDFYYGMHGKSGLALLSCVGSIEGHGYVLVETQDALEV